MKRTVDQLLTLLKESDFNRQDIRILKKIYRRQISTIHIEEEMSAEINIKEECITATIV